MKKYTRKKIWGLNEDEKIHTIETEKCLDIKKHSEFLLANSKNKLASDVPATADKNPDSISNSGNTQQQNIAQCCPRQECQKTKRF